MTKSKNKQRASKRKGQRTTKRNTKPAHGEHESAFRRLVIHTLGLTRAQEILAELASIGL